ncbi:hypothetical protein QEN19_001111 [Hanseniaspora menglaensis]
MSKRASDSDSKKNGSKKAKYNHSKPQTHLEPNTRGIYISCDRGKEFRAKQEILDLFEDKYEELLEKKVFVAVEGTENGNEDAEETNKSDLDIEEQLKLEMDDLKKKNKQDVKRGSLFQFIELQMECLFFVKVHKTIDPVVLTLAVLEDAKMNNVKRTRYVSKIMPIMDSCSASKENFDKVLTSVYSKFNRSQENKNVEENRNAEEKSENSEGETSSLGEKNQEAVIYSVDITRRLFKVIERDDIMRMATGKLRELNSSLAINYKEFDNLLIIQCFKSNIGFSIVKQKDWLAYKKFNLTQIFESKDEN